MAAMIIGGLVAWGLIAVFSPSPTPAASADYSERDSLRSSLALQGGRYIHPDWTPAPASPTLLATVDSLGGVEVVAVLCPDMGEVQAWHIGTGRPMNLGPGAVLIQDQGCGYYRLPIGPAELLLWAVVETPRAQPIEVTARSPRGSVTFTVSAADRAALRAMLNYHLAARPRD